MKPTRPGDLYSMHVRHNFIRLTHIDQVIPSACGLSNFEYTSASNVAAQTFEDESLLKIEIPVDSARKRTNLCCHCSSALPATGRLKQLVSHNYYKQLNFQRPISAVSMESMRVSSKFQPNSKKTAFPRCCEIANLWCKLAKS